MRDFNSPEYKAFRLKVFKRDKFTCQFPNCNSKKGLNAHHIKRWVDYPELRYALDNGITICYYHHKMVTGKELDYEALFISIVNRRGKRELDFLAKLKKKYEEIFGKSG